MPANHHVKRLKRSWLVPLAALGMSGCSTLGSNMAAELAIDSIPAGAEVSVMGESRGVTPLRLPTNTIFPVTYSPEKQSLYGKVRITHPDCAPYETPVSNKALEHGIHARLECKSPTTPAAVAPQAQTPRERLKQLEALKQEGLLDEQEYRQARQRIIDSL